MSRIGAFLLAGLAVAVLAKVIAVLALLSFAALAIALLIRPREVVGLLILGALTTIAENHPLAGLGIAIAVAVVIRPLADLSAAPALVASERKAHKTAQTKFNG